MKFYCNSNKITSFDKLILPPSIIIFNCSRNQITSFAGLKLPKSLKEFWCAGNHIKSFAELVLPNSLKTFGCDDERIEVIQNFVFPPNLTELIISLKTKLVNSKFNSALEHRLKSEFDFNRKIDHGDIIFLYLNFDMTYDRYDQLLNKLV
jgi:Leucine-rich repeat (LRR) protein